MIVQMMATAVGLCAGLQAMRLSWDPRLTRVASVAAFVCGVGLVQSLMPFLLRLIAPLSANL